MKKGIKRSKYWLFIVDLLEKYFPKNKCKERGQAIVLICEIEKMLQESVKNKENTTKRSKKKNSVRSNFLNN